MIVLFSSSSCSCVWGREKLLMSCVFFEALVDPRGLPLPLFAGGPLASHKCWILLLPTVCHSDVGRALTTGRALDGNTGIAPEVLDVNWNLGFSSRTWSAGLAPVKVWLPASKLPTLADQL